MHGFIVSGASNLLVKVLGESLCLTLVSPDENFTFSALETNGIVSTEPFDLPKMFTAA